MKLKLSKTTKVGFLSGVMIGIMVQVIRTYDTTELIWFASGVVGTIVLLVLLDKWKERRLIRDLSDEEERLITEEMERNAANLTKWDDVPF